MAVAAADNIKGACINLLVVQWVSTLGVMHELAVNALALRAAAQS